MSRVLLTGITGFVGSALARRLLKEGHQVFALVRPGSDFWRISDIAHQCDIRYVDLRDVSALRYIVKSIEPQIVYHFAANKASPLITSVNDDISTNIIGTKNLLQALEDCPYEVFVNAGSSSEYGYKDSAMNEEDVLQPNSYHAFAKAAQTLLCQAAAKAEGHPIVTLRLFSVYGPYERLDRLISSVVRKCINHEELSLSSPWVSRDFVYVDDVVDACMKTEALSQKSGEIINIGTGMQTNIQELVDMVFGLVGHSVPCKWNSDERSWDAPTWVADCSKARSFLGWQAKHPLCLGLAKTIIWADEHDFK